MMKLAPFAAFFFLACATTPASNAVTDGSGEPTPAQSVEPAAESAAAPPAASANKCVQAGGACSPLTATNVCKRSETGAEWGCEQSQHCCIN